MVCGCDFCMSPWVLHHLDLGDGDLVWSLPSCPKVHEIWVLLLHGSFHFMFSCRFHPIGVLKSHLTLTSMSRIPGCLAIGPQPCGTSAPLFAWSLLGCFEWGSLLSKNLSVFAGLQRHGHALCIWEQIWAILASSTCSNLLLRVCPLGRVLSLLGREVLAAASYWGTLWSFKGVSLSHPTPYQTHQQGRSPQQKRLACISLLLQAPVPSDWEARLFLRCPESGLRGMDHQPFICK